MTLKRKGAAGAAAGAAVGSIVPGIGTGNHYGTFSYYRNHIKLVACD